MMHFLCHLASIAASLEAARAALLIQIFQNAQDTEGLYDNANISTSLPGAAILQSMSFGASTPRSLSPSGGTAWDSGRPSVNYISIVKSMDEGSVTLWRNVLDREVFASISILKTLNDGTLSMFWKLQNAVVVEYDGNLMTGNVSDIEHITFGATTITYGVYPPILPGQTNYYGPAYVWYDLQSNTLNEIA